MKPKHTPLKEFGNYLISSTGSVYSKTKWRGEPIRLQAQHPDKDGYPCVRLVVNGKRTKYRVHRLMAQLFLGPKLSKAHEVRHLDGVRSNNFVENLCYGTRKDNAADREKHGKTQRGQNHAQSIITGIKKSKEANAHLIAAAPDLLEFAKRIVDSEFNFGNKREDYAHEQIWNIVVDAKALIAKAEGGAK